MRTYAVVAANMSIALAVVRVPHKKVKATVKVATRPKCAGILVTLYRMVMAAIGIKEAKLMATNAATLSKPSSEQWTVFPEYSVPFGFLFAS